MKIRFCLIAALALPALLTACQSAPKKRPVVTPQNMLCNETVPASITFFSPEEARLVYAGKSYDLKREISASGAKYGSRAITFWNKGADATILQKDTIIAHCTNLPKSGL